MRMDEGYRNLNIGETILPTDEWLDAYKWKPVRKERAGTMYRLGMPAYRRLIPTIGAINISKDFRKAGS